MNWIEWFCLGVVLLPWAYVIYRTGADAAEESEDKIIEEYCQDLNNLTSYRQTIGHREIGRALNLFIHRGKNGGVM